MASSLDWDHEGRDWPHRESSRFVQAGGLRWHVQTMGSGPVALLIHGTGSSTHSWRGLMPLLAQRFTVVAMDLPGHAFTATPPTSRMSLPGLSGLLGALVDTLALDVDLVVGHSAGAAIGTRMVLDSTIAPRAIVAINGAFLPLSGLPGLLFPPVARLMSFTPLAAQLFARRNWTADAVKRLMAGTGSNIDAEGLALYGALLRDPRHAAGALAMMARWDLSPLARDLAALRTALVLIVGDCDRAVPPGDAARVRELLPVDTTSVIEWVDGAGHLVHEERPAEVACRIAAAVPAAPAAPPAPNQGRSESITS